MKCLKNNVLYLSVFFILSIGACCTTKNKNPQETTQTSDRGKKRPQTEKDCIDPAKIDPNGICIQLYKPVCGCDGKTYSNACVADKSGVLHYTEGACKGQ